VKAKPVVVRYERQRPGELILDRLVLLVRGELGLAAETLPVRLGARAALAGADAD
jgi:hypothetical protein